jgi:nitrate/nitrite transport system substrate-binding protein
MPPEKTRLKIGIVPLIDAAPVIVAKERGFFAEQGLSVEISREPSWSNIRDKVAVGVLDAAQMLATMPLAGTLGLGAIRRPMVAAFALNLGGNAITLSVPLSERLAGLVPDDIATPIALARALKATIDADRRARRTPMTFAVVYPTSTHAYELRYWMATAGIDPDRDLRLIVVPPPQMVAHLSAGNIDGYCVGEPWNSLAVSLGLGRIVATSADIWSGRLEKVLGTTRAWADAHPETHKALLKALIEAARWADAPENRAEVADIVAKPSYVNVPREVAHASLLGEFRFAPEAVPAARPDFVVFHRYAANFPWRSQAIWYLREMRRWSHRADGENDRRIAEGTYRPDIFRMAALELGLSVPTVDYKSEGGHFTPWTLERATGPIPMSPDAFIDGSRFDPNHPAGSAATPVSARHDRNA